LKRCISLFLVFSVLITASVSAQDTLPNFTVVDRGEKVTISWVNPFPNIIQLSVQRSFDSVRNFTSVFSATSPQLPQNGFTENKMPTNRIFYRIFYVLEGGNYFFTEAKRVGAPSGTAVSSRDIKNANLLNVNANDNRKVTIKLRDAIFRQIPAFQFKSFRDSILRQTKDTLFAINDSLVMLRPFVGVESWRPSMFVFANRDGYINIVLPMVHQRKYHIRFFEDNGDLVFEIPHVRESPILLDKANFIHAGWFYFELYEDDKLKEKNKFYLPKDF
jgi:hypothetical protein